MLRISVIVPVYKVEKYLCQCLDGILNQTYQNLEVILVDDGSPDRCPQICDEYAAKDSRVIVIHKTNGGLSDARNYGVEAATGEYGIFIDSDDYWYDQGALDYLVTRIEKSKPDILSFPYLYDDEGSGRKSVKLGNNCNMPLLLSSKEEQLEFLILRGLYIASACNKMIKIQLLKNNPFERGKVAEDILWCAKLLCEAESFDYVNYCFYCYRQIIDSISHN
ncbi:MAG: glycosyltransferase family 2 protein, partial [Oscillospiraceae bacterium]|nr:glycosyltransferase family 2 protein [Oscillospiraceae bacterium]